MRVQTILVALVAFLPGALLATFSIAGHDARADGNPVLTPRPLQSNERVIGAGYSPGGPKWIMTVRGDNTDFRLCIWHTPDATTPTWPTEAMKHIGWVCQMLPGPLPSYAESTWAFP
ncbi:MAG TPA: hypothetical protein VNH64_11785 [Parvularculaceae bacterium]|nr:hypothetical protein [Parvularculaceae bacterium]